MANKELDLFKDIIPAVDFGIKELYDAASEDGKKDIKGDLWNLNRYISSVSGSYEKQALQLLKVNEYYNKNWASLGAKHPKLQWMLLCAAGRTGKKEFHTWISLKKTTESKTAKILKQIYPDLKDDEVETLDRISTKEEIRELAREYGIDDVKL